MSDHEPAVNPEQHPDESAQPPSDPMASSEMIHVDRYEGAWMRISAAVIVIFVVALAIAGFGQGFQVPGQYARITPEELLDPSNPFYEAGLRELAPGKYEAYVVAQMWNFRPAEIRVPAGAEITFYVTAADVQHGFKLSDTNINMMALPGQVGAFTATFDEPGVYHYICHEYCGYVAGSSIGHQTMYGTLIVEEPAEAGQKESVAAKP